MNDFNFNRFTDSRDEILISLIAGFIPLATLGALFV